MAAQYATPSDVSKGSAFSSGMSAPPPAVVHTTSVPPPHQSSTAHERNAANQGDTTIQLELKYLKTPVGILSIFITVHSFIGLIVMVSSYGTHYYLSGAYGFYIFVAVVDFLFSAAVIFIGLMQFPDEHPNVPWPVLLVSGFAIVSFFELIASCLVAARAQFPRDGACAVLGFVILQCYLVCLTVTLPDAIHTVNTSTRARLSPLREDVQAMDFPPAYAESVQPINLSISTGDTNAQS